MGHDHLFRSEVLIEVGAPLEVRPYVTERGEQDAEAVKRLTERMAGALREIVSTRSYPSSAGGNAEAG